MATTGSHFRLTRSTADGDYHLTVPLHNPLRVGTLNAIITELAGQLKMNRLKLVRQLTEIVLA